MSFSLLSCTIVAGVTTLGFAWPIVARWTLAPAEKLVAGIALSLVGVFCVAWVIYVFALPAGTLSLLPLVAAFGVAARWPEFRITWSDTATRSILIGQAIVTAWCVGWLATVASYSGGGWAGDWFEHWERARFFLERSSFDTKMLGQYALTARPPLANIVTGAFLGPNRIDFPPYQLVSTLLASVAFSPAALLASRWGGPRAIAVLAVLVMVNPLFVQNTTFAWTKLPAAFFVLTALHFFLQAQGPSAPRAAAPLCGLCLAAGFLTHYSAGPYVVALAVAWLGFGWPRRCDPAWWRTTASAAITGTLLLATWFAWSLAVYGAQTTLLTNPSVTSSDARQGNQLVKITLNFFDTLVPHFLRPLDQALIAQSSSWGRWHDWFFQNYQVNLPLAFGSIALVVIVRELARSASTANRRDRAFWSLFIAGVVVLGTATHGQRDHWGLAHICLQALVILGLAWLAARWSTLTPAWRRALIAGAIFDFIFGVALHFAAQSFALERWFAPGRSLTESLGTWSQAAQMNLIAKVTHRLVFFSDAIAVPLTATVAFLAFLLVVALRRARSPAPVHPTSP